MPKTRRERRKAKRSTYLDGTARNPHRHTPVLKKSLEEETTSSSGGSPSLRSSLSTSICPQCKPVLSRYSTTFKAMIHQGSELKKKKAINPQPVRTDIAHYRDIVGQNEWLRQNMFDTLGNYLYCSACIRSALGVSKDRLTRQRSIKRLRSQHPIMEMSKSEIEKCLNI